MNPLLTRHFWFLLSLSLYPLYFNTISGAASYWLYGTDPETSKTQKVQNVVDKFKYCTYYECCTPNHIPYDIDGLKADFNEHLFGQHIANATIIPALKSHINNLDNSQKPLVMSFHGTPGTGKNFVADFIARRFYKAGDESKYVHRYRGRIDFPLDTQVPYYRVCFEREKSRFRYFFDYLKNDFFFQNIR